jgi:hypothetical protein
MHVLCCIAAHPCHFLLTGRPVEEALRTAACWDVASRALQTPVLAACKQMRAQQV